MNQTFTTLNELQSYFGVADWASWTVINYTYYDYVRLDPAGSTQLDFFVQAVGSADPISGLPKTSEQTNLPRSRQFGQVYFLLEEIRTHIHVLPKARQAAGVAALTEYLTDMTATMEEILNLYNRGVFEFTIGQSLWTREVQPFQRMPAGFGVEVNTYAVEAGNTVAEWVQQPNDERDVYKVTPNILIEPDQNIGCQILFPDGATPVFTNLIPGNLTAAINIGVQLRGHLLRPAQ